VLPAGAEPRPSTNCPATMRGMSTEAAESLTRFLTQADGYNRKSPLVQRVEAEITAMATTIAR
jgi:hypothetical protein